MEKQGLLHNLFYSGQALCLFLCLLLSWSVEAATVEVEIYGMEFHPKTITIAKGDTVVWVNKEKRQYHSVWFSSLGEEESEYFWPEETFQKQFNEAGVFHYRCGPHEKMQGIVEVK